MRMSWLTRADQKFGILGPAKAVHAKSGVGRIGLQVKGSSLGGLLLVVVQLGQAGGEGVSYAEVHTIVLICRAIIEGSNLDAPPN